MILCFLRSPSATFRIPDPKSVYAELVEPKATVGQPLFFSSRSTLGRMKKKQSFDKLRISGVGVR
jgi:hypothetical protein